MLARTIEVQICDKKPPISHTSFTKILTVLERCDDLPLRDHNNKINIFKFDDILFGN